MGRRRSSWIQKQRSDKYYQKSKEEGHRARSYYKLKQINEKFNIIPVNQRDPPKILDLGAAPGAWLEYVSQIFNENWNIESIPKNRIIGMDLTTIHPLDSSPFVSTYRVNIFKGKCKRLLQDLGPFDVILSDLAPKTAGDDRDIAIQASMVRKIADYLSYLKFHGNIVIKVFQSSESYDLFQLFKKRFSTFTRTKPQASRKSSRELYFIGLDFIK